MQILQKSLLHLWRNLIELIEIDEQKLYHRPDKPDAFPTEKQVVTDIPTDSSGGIRRRQKVLLL